MARKSSRRNRRDNVAVSLDLSDFVRRLSRATGWEGEIGDGELKPGSYRTGEYSCTERAGSSPSRFSVDYLFEHLLSKFDDGKPSEDKEKATWERFYRAERLCRDTNERLIYDQTYRSPKRTSLGSLLEVARVKIGHMLGDFDWDEAASRFSFGPGGTTRLPRRLSDAAYKYSGVPETTAGNLALASAAIWRNPLWLESLLLEGTYLPQVVVGNKVITVPKNYKTDRTIAKEPCMNIYVQKGIGAMIRKRLKRHGVDLNDQTVNQRYARDALSLGLCTIDMSMASDTISYELVRNLLPPDWFSALEQCRSPIGVLPSGERIVYRKFSSMGNGYTFELESMIFYGLMLAVVECYGVKDAIVSVYGDDLIFPAQWAPELIQLLEFCGFVVNLDKSFTSGPFRESCGKHYYHGYDVTPFYVKKKPELLTDLFLLHNQIYRWCVRNFWNSRWHRGEMRDLLAFLRSLAPKSWRKPSLPDGFGDGAFIGTFDEATPRAAASFPKTRGWEGFRARSMVSLSDTKDFDGFGQLVLGLLILDKVEDSSLSYLDEPRAGVGPKLAPRVRQSNIVVPQYPGWDPFQLLLPHLRMGSEA